MRCVVSRQRTAGTCFGWESARLRECREAIENNFWVFQCWKGVHGGSCLSVQTAMFNQGAPARRVIGCHLRAPPYRVSLEQWTQFYYLSRDRGETLRLGWESGSPVETILRDSRAFAAFLTSWFPRKKCSVIAFGPHGTSMCWNWRL